MPFLSRAAAGRDLGRLILNRGVRPDVVLGLPRGGVVVAAEVARFLNCPLDSLVVRKIGHPEQPEFAVGAIAEGGIVVVDQLAQKRTGVDRDKLSAVIAEETERARKHEAEFHPHGRLDLSGTSALIVDDGLATGATVEAAVLAARKLGAAQVRVAAPVASAHAVKRLEKLADEVIVIVIDPDFMAVGQYYESFPQTEDQEVIDLLNEAARLTDARREGHGG